MSDPKRPEAGQVWENGKRRRVEGVIREAYTGSIARVAWRPADGGAIRHTSIRGWLDWARGATLEESTT